MQGPPDDEALQGLDGYEQMVNIFAENAKAYWRLWGPLGEPMVRIVEAWAEQQRSYLRWLRQNYRGGIDPNPPSKAEQWTGASSKWSPGPVTR